MMRRSSLSLRFGAACAALTLGAWLTPLGAQDRLLPTKAGTIGPIYEHWSFGSGLRQPSSDGAATVELRSASAWSIPLNASVGFGKSWTFDLSTTYSNGIVQLRGTDASIGSTDYSLSGLTDVHARATGHVVGDNVLVTVGANLPTGPTSLGAEEYAALRVLSAPALAMQQPALGTGLGGTAGLVFARQIASWAWAFGASYELRRSYTPIAYAAGAPAPDVDPGDAVHLSVGTDGFVGQSGMTLALSADLFTDDRLDATAPTGGTSVPTATVTTHLGPIFTVDWQLHVASTSLRDLTLYAVDRYRTPYDRDGRQVAESNGNYLDAGVRAVFPLSPATGILSIVNLRHQTGLKSDSTFATAATAGAGLTLGLVQSFGNGLWLQPFARADYGKIKSVDTSVGATGFAAGITLGRRF